MASIVLSGMDMRMKQADQTRGQEGSIAQGDTFSLTYDLGINRQVVNVISAQC